ncbi:cysteine desulfurase family protein [Malonomonas rubra DSM 5091]|uniref:cysteine desulfurase n=1 Tax=Malonomonas rubra DSM 5091 TaxID=1122189 RepID=A0A1M6B2W2_MALRU|nr:aminotransferase class V-fold PLP-dependent enzyme [Malonomonas rubra]SHI43089.1 cysteine desulfurase family protein [Malonomonas rubra DSM 5091]
MNDLIYLDNAATSHPKPEAVYLAVERALRQGASPGRGSYQQALSAERLVFDTRESIAELFNAPDSERIIFTANATNAINQALFGLLQPGDRVVTTSIEHNAVTRPLRALQDNGVDVVKVAADSRSGLVEENALKDACLEKTTKLLLVNHCSNVFGGMQPVEGLGDWCRERGIYFMIDGSQSAGSLPIDFQQLQVDLFAAPGHKSLLGPQGTGFLYVDKEIALRPLVYGGTGANSHSDLPPEDLPERLECGTLNLPGLAGLQAAVQFLLQTGTVNIREHELQTLSYLLDGLRSIDGVVLYGPEDIEKRGAAVSFNITGRDPAEVGFYLDHEAQIAVRVGLQCAPDAHRTINTYPHGTVRVSPGFFTTQAELDTFLAAIRNIAQRDA